MNSLFYHHGIIIFINDIDPLYSFRATQRLGGFLSMRAMSVKQLSIELPA
jgi:hypothetical protein